MGESCSRSKAIRRFVCSEVWACISDFGAYLADADFDNAYVLECPTCGQEIDPTDTDALSEEDYGGTGLSVYVCPNCNTEFSDADGYIDKDIFEYWIVSPFLGELLRYHGEPIVERDLGWIWGRTCTGQSIELDGVIGEICEEIGLFGDSQEDAAE